MPLGKLSKAQIAKGFDALEDLQAALDRKAGKKDLSELSSRFYTIIPHNFGRQTPPVINSLEVLQAKKDMLLVPDVIIILCPITVIHDPPPTHRNEWEVVTAQPLLQ